MDDRTDRQDAKARLVAAMDAGCRWDEAAHTAGILVSRSTAYRLSLRAGREGPSAFVDGRHGHASKLRDPHPAWIAASCHAQPHASSPQLQQAIQAEFDRTISVRHLSRVRTALGVPWVRPPRQKKRRRRSGSLPDVAGGRREFAPPGRCACNRPPASPDRRAPRSAQGRRLSRD